MLASSRWTVAALLVALCPVACTGAESTSPSVDQSGSTADMGTADMAATGNNDSTQSATGNAGGGSATGTGAGVTSGDQTSSGSTGAQTAGGGTGGGANVDDTSAATLGSGGQSSGEVASGSDEAGGESGNQGGMSMGGNPADGAAGASGGSDPSSGGQSSNSGGAGTTAVGAGPSTLPAPPGDANVPVPSGAPGGLTVLDWAGFTAAVSYTFDDSNSSQIQNYDELQARGVPMTFYLQTNKSESTSDTWARALADGHELGNHTHSHQDGGAAVGADTDTATEFIEQQFDTRVWTMAAPYGNTDYVDVARTRFLINRGVNGGLVAPNGNADPFNLNCYIPATGAPASAFNQHVDAARSAGAWQIMLVHGFTGGSDSAYQPVDLAEFLASVDYAIALGDVWISSVVEIGAYWRAQKLFSELSVASVDAGNSWSWTLPDHFPPGKYLRVTVDGGTLAQDGTPLTWDPHGYYEVALDVPSLVLSP